MQSNDGDSDSDQFSYTERGVPGAGPSHPVNHHAVAHELDQMRTEALKDIDEGGFSCVASLSVPVF